MRLLIAALLVLIAAQALASSVFTCTETVSGGGFTLACVPACSHNLNFSQSCNSQYINIVGI
jgi:hypothetical protein